jgi:hypothetical protein
MEASSEYYYSQLAKADNPGVILSAFYCGFYGIKQTRSEIIMFNKLLKVFSRFTVFSSVMDLIGSKHMRMEDPYPYLFEICQRKFETTHLDSSLQARESLTKYLEKLDEELEEFKKNRKKLKIPILEEVE